jgi:GcrA cell cycle regulator
MSWRVFPERVLSVTLAREAGQAMPPDSARKIRNGLAEGFDFLSRPSQQARPKMSWTDEKVELLRQLWMDGRSASQISAVLGQGLTRNAVIGKVHRLGLAGRAKSSSPASPGSSGTPRAAQPRRMAPRATNGGGGGGGSSGVSTGALSSGHMVHGNTVMAMMHDTAVEAQPSRVKEDVVVPMSLRVTIVELKEAMCRWPLGDPSSSEFRYCGSPAPGVAPYCSHHGKLAYQPVQDRRRERDRDRRTLIAN